MSASLVGSGDVYKRQDQEIRPVTEPMMQTQLRSGSITAKRKGVGAAPVSYTHLTLPTICSV
eukprot:12745609-Alexandrium_andersonii.AAC.1